MGLIAYLINLAFDLYIGVIIIQIVIHWLIAFDVFKVRSPQAQNLMDVMKRMTDPVYRPLRKVIPAIGGIDVTPIIVIVGLSVVRNLILGALL